MAETIHNNVITLQLNIRYNFKRFKKKERKNYVLSSLCTSKRINLKVLSTSLGLNVFWAVFLSYGLRSRQEKLLAIQESSFIKTGQPSLTQASPREAAPLISWFWLNKVRLKDSSFLLAFLFSLGVILLRGVECTILSLYLFSLVAQVREFMGERRRAIGFFSIPAP